MRIAILVAALAACSGRSAPTTGDTPADHIAAASQVPSGMRADHPPGTPRDDAAAIELATISLQLDDVEKALQDAIPPRPIAR